MNPIPLHKLLRYCNRKIVTCFLLLPLFVLAQYPQYFSHNSENGLPGNEIYSIEQDKQGFIWIGSDAGLYKYNGIRYISYKCQSQQSKSVAGLTVSPSGKLYCYNFQGQLFVIENDSLKEIKHPATKIAPPTTDQHNNVIITHDKGISVYNEHDKTWKTYNNFGEEALYVSKSFTRSAKATASGKICFITTSGLGTLSNQQISITPNDYFKDLPISSLMLESWQDKIFVFSSDNNNIFVENNGSFQLINSGKLNAILKNRKITNVNCLKDNLVWICTYNGIVSYNPKNDSCRLFYPGIVFTDCLLDREKNYWFTTLQNGLLRVPQLGYNVWNSDFNLPLKNDKITKVDGNENDIFFTNVNGLICHLNAESGTLSYYHTGNDADVQCLHYNTGNNCLYFNQSNKIHRLKDGYLSSEKMYAPSVKSFLFINNLYLMGSSLGLISARTSKDSSKINSLWTRDLFYDKNTQHIYTSTDKGLLVYKLNGHELTKEKTHFENTQILNSDKGSGLYVLTFNGMIFCITKNGITKHVASLPKNVQANKLKVHNTKLYIATNAGLYVYDTETNSWNILNQLSGLSSNNIQDLYISPDVIWLATGNGLQQVSVHTTSNNKLPLIYNRGTSIDAVKTSNVPEFDYGQTLIITPEVSSYSSYGNFQYAWRLKGQENNWTYLPGNIEQIEIPNIPDGVFELEIKAIDHLGHDSENSISIKGYVKPPFWKNTWLHIVLTTILLLVVILFYKKRINILKEKQQKKIERLHLENELRLTQQTALKAQMNPHFIFNVLNSIKGYIYKNDKQNATRYLSDFADLIRTVLSMSSMQQVSLHDELNMLKLYIELEAMMFTDNFSYEIAIDPSIDPHHLKIPALLIQPFIENAFKHGLRHKQENKKLYLGISSNKNQLSITVTDNGIGRSAAAKIKSDNTVNHQSFATGAITKRIDLINREGKQLVTEHTTDLFDDSGNSTGTSVILSITYHE